MWIDYSQEDTKMEGNENKSLLDLERKLQTLFQYEKELAKETKNESHRTDILEDELNSIKKKIEELEHQVSLLNKKSSPELINYKAFTPAEIADMKNKMSWSEMSRYLKCSITTCQRLVRKGKEEQKNG